MDYSEALMPLAILTLGATVLVVIIWQVFATWRARAALTREREYQKLAEAAANTQQAIERRLDEISTQLAGMHDRLAAAERLLREVE
ncbi:hypothetical protein [Micromonospora sp. HM5-17]|jgi:hypothetical protein|uniref:hypothetical protein n=1 Tax=Micromonospora sp. HM5-17 TaxID=2487710 RepID=UPI000F46ED9C|nr:hypothetical protein [Micromonospora sp. HM5-17]ROT33583.1 hypothetical protein EF879_01095 [Micromonospora sp. HM5-17]